MRLCGSLVAARRRCCPPPETPGTEEHYKQRESATRSGDVLEGALDFRRLPLDGRLPATFSRGLPDDVLATWDGAWQVAPPLGRAAAAPQAAALRLNGAVGVLRFSRPVVVRRLLLRPPLHAEGGPLGGAPRRVDLRNSPPE